ncbi:MAG: ATP-binding protein [Desulfobacterales bacterium]|nr:ATP-binding protein [Desulfobacterales bacterium]
MKKYKGQPLSSFNVLVGPNASGKTTFLDVVSFLSDLVSEGLEKAVNEKTANFYDLVWKKSGNYFELAIEIAVPEHVLKKLPFSSLDQIRYEISIGMNEYNEVSILAEKGLLKRKRSVKQKQRTFFPEQTITDNESILTSAGTRNGRLVFNKTPAGKDNYYKNIKGGRQKYVFNIGPYNSTLGNLPDIESLYPVTAWLKNFHCSWE